MQPRIYSAVLFALVFAFGVATARAEAPALQTKSLVARQRVKTWRSVKFPSNEVVQARLFSEGNKELSQEGYERCGAWYLGKEISVRLDVVHCKNSAQGQTWYVLRYSSLNGAQRLTVKLYPLS
jgi:hypothetical protein